MKLSFLVLLFLEEENEKDGSRNEIVLLQVSNGSNSSQALFDYFLSSIFFSTSLSFVNNWFVEESIFRDKTEFPRSNVFPLKA